MNYSEQHRSIDLQWNYQWNFTIKSYTPDLNPYEETKFLVKNITLPFVSLETETQPSGNKVYSKIIDFDDFTAEFMETSDFQVKKFFTAWQNSTFDPEKRVFKKNPPYYTATLSLFRYQFAPSIGLNGFSPSLSLYEELDSVTYDFKQLKFKSIDPIQFDYSSTDPITYSVTFTCDYIDENFKV